jgi:DNA/RNA endonuclease YhcR with UshA esterase domain
LTLLAAATSGPSPLQAQAVVEALHADEHVGEDVVVEGRVASVYTSRKGNTFLNFEQPYPDQVFTAVLFRQNRRLFGDLRRYEGRVVRVSGRIKLYRGKPEIILDSPSQLQTAKSSE